MKGLLLKDFYNLKAAMKTLIIILAIFIAFVIIRNYEFILPLIPVLLSSSLLTTVVSMDKNSKWNMLMMTAPLKRKELVQEKYLLLLLLNAGGNINWHRFFCTVHFIGKDKNGELCRHDIAGVEPFVIAGNYFPYVYVCI